MRTLVVAAIALVLLEWWRRAIRDRAPRWINVVAILLSIEIVVGAVIAEYRLQQAFDSIGSDDGSNKATGSRRASPVR
jgi:heme A synthase